MPPTEPSAADGAVAGRESASSGTSPARARSGRPRPDPPSPDTLASRARDFPREARLLNGRAYDAVFADNRRFADRYWTVLAHTAATGHGARLGLAIAKKRARRAVDRNRIKRVARESFRHARRALGDRHVVVMNRDAAAAAHPVELRRALDALWARMLRQSRGGPERREGGQGGRRREAVDGARGARDDACGAASERDAARDVVTDAGSVPR